MLEICVDTFESARAAVEGGADRLELCSALSEGGLTPNLGLFKVIKAKFPSITVFAMLRPVNRTSFTHSDTDMENILFDMKAFAQHGVDGFVFGALDSKREIDVPKCKLVIESANGLPVTFHRAFDQSIPARNLQNIELISSLGFQRLLTSGFAETAEIGIPALTILNDFVKENGLNLIIMPGCGITPANAERILTETRCREFHGSAKAKLVEVIPADGSDTPGITAAIRNNAIYCADKATVIQLAQIRTKVLKTK